MAPNLRMVFVFLFSYIEGLPILGSIFPGGTISLLIGVLSQDGFIKPLNAILITMTGGFLGDITGFFIGRKLKHLSFVKKIIHNEKHQRKWEVFDRQIIIISILGRLIPLVRSIPSIFAGARNNISVTKYLILSLVGSAIWAASGVYGGIILSLFTGRFAIPIILGILVVSVIATLIVNYKDQIKKHVNVYTDFKK